MFATTCALLSAQQYSQIKTQISFIYCVLVTARTQSNLNALVAISNGMWAVKLCTNKILHFLTGGAG